VRSMFSCKNNIFVISTIFLFLSRWTYGTNMPLSSNQKLKDVKTLTSFVLKTSFLKRYCQCDLWCLDIMVEKHHQTLDVIPGLTMKSRNN
jgi:hypothetical protein